MFEQDKNGFIFPVKSVFIITWTGRDSDSDIWDEYPVYRFGFYTEEARVKEKVAKLNARHPGEYDSDAEETERYDYKEIKIAKDN